MWGNAIFKIFFYSYPQATCIMMYNANTLWIWISSVLIFWNVAIGQGECGTAQVVLKDSQVFAFFHEVLLIYARQKWALGFLPVLCLMYSFYVEWISLWFSKSLANGSSGKNCSVKSECMFSYFLCCIGFSVRCCMLYCRTNMSSASSIKSTAILQRESQWKTDEAGSCGSLISK